MFLFLGLLNDTVLVEKRIRNVIRVICRVLSYLFNGIDFKKAIDSRTEVAACLLAWICFRRRSSSVVSLLMSGMQQVSISGWSVEKSVYHNLVSKYSKHSKHGTSISSKP